jgi:hypothetical protein
MAEIDQAVPELAGFFKVKVTGRVHCIKRTEWMQNGKRTWMNVLYWCGNFSIADRGEFLYSNALEPLRCERCLHDQRRALVGGAVRHR